MFSILCNTFDREYNTYTLTNTQICAKNLSDRVTRVTIQKTEQKDHL